ncbi:unnamed protein product [Penicillium salamii]|uniref:Zn(2)-C6 fungal-type domain-containing protein n=1 Tax=Penicillium salamii TaxID=1612424 RepID=A0A9W4I754_9EURO|nr:unnamed protein product [Penicillium salamii]
MLPKDRRMASSDRNPQESQDEPKSQEDVPACQSCRKKKARCSRAQPCAECTRSNVDCVYDERRMKPGLRAGAVDQLYRRVETLENMFLGQEILWQQMWKTENPDGLLLDRSDRSTTIENLAQRREKLKSVLLNASSNLGQSHERGYGVDSEPSASPAKRRRCEPTPSCLPSARMEVNDLLSSTEVMGELVDFYFVNVHPWIPVLHQARFRNRIESPSERPRVTCILHAIVAVCAKFCQSDSLRDKDTRINIAEQSRQRVILESMETFSVENLQALVIIAFDTIGRGRGPSSWSIVGSMVGTVEQLQLDVEEDEISRSVNPGETLIRRMVFLTPPSSWSEAEERRRVFWAVFLMDRFCNVSTGWKISLTSADVKRRLPCEGSIWANEKEVRTPYFGISATKDTMSTNSPPVGDPGSTNSDEEELIGGFAYNIEATESLALVTNFFLHHAFNVSDTVKARIWLMKFKELDLRLMQWKLYMPEKWREASVLNGDGVMDPNLTLAHITHNTAVILLHQGIAYPPPHWRNCPIKLPSASSAETCLDAASEIATIGHQFLSISPIFTNPQFSFCLFIASRMILTHARYNQIPVPPALDILISSLLEISQRWTGREENADPVTENLASSFAKRLTEAQSNSAAASRPSLDIRQTAYSDESREQPLRPHPMGTSSHGSTIPGSRGTGTVPPAENMGKPPFQEPYDLDPFSLAFPPLPLAFQQDFAVFPGSNQMYEGPSNGLPHPNLGAQSHDPQLAPWQGHNGPVGNNVVSPPDHLGYVLDLVPSPSQRISRYSGGFMES